LVSSFSRLSFDRSLFLRDEPPCPLLDIVGQLPEKMWVTVSSYDSMIAVCTKKPSDFARRVVVVDCKPSVKFFGSLLTNRTPSILLFQELVILGGGYAVSTL
jgi:hypothetical protein